MLFSNNEDRDEENGAAMAPPSGVRKAVALGASVFVVGGAVRDMLLGTVPRDVDWAIAGLTPEQMREIGFRAVGSGFEVFLDPDTGDEVVLASGAGGWAKRRAREYVRVLAPEPHIADLLQDLARRDMAINAMAMAMDGNVIDPFDGYESIRSRTLSHLSKESFEEDPVRVLRVARFCATLADGTFSIAPKTIKLMQEIANRGMMDNLVIERVWKETEKALGARHPSRYFRALAECGAASKAYPVLGTMSDGASLAMLDAAAGANLSKECRLALMLGEIVADSQDPGQKAAELCERMGAPNSYRTMATRWANHGSALAEAGRRSSRDILSAFKGVRAYQDSSALDVLMSMAKVHERQMGRTLSARFECGVQKAMRASARIQAEDIVDQGFSGSEIGKELDRKRLAAIEKTMSKVGKGSESSPVPE